jgi:cell division transport system ATP-binding protein
MVRLSGVSKWYFSQTRILDHINLELKKGEFLYVIGGSGAGKSSLLRILATHEAPSMGSLSLFGYNVATASQSTLRAIRQSLGYVPQEVRLIPDLTVYDNVALSLSLAGKRVLNAECRRRIHEILERMGLEEKRETLAQTLSGGEAQRVAVARALVRNPELIIADEPTGAQDRDFKWLLMDLFLKANATGATVVLATHDREIVRRVRKRSAVLRGGHIAFEEAMCIY